MYCFDMSNTQSFIVGRNVPNGLRVINAVPARPQMAPANVCPVTDGKFSTRGMPEYTIKPAGSDMKPCYADNGMSQTL